MLRIRHCVGCAFLIPPMAANECSTTKCCCQVVKKAFNTMEMPDFTTFARAEKRCVAALDQNENVV